MSKVQEYIDSVGGKAHQSAVTIITDLEGGSLVSIIEERAETYYLRAIVSKLLESQIELIKLCGEKGKDTNDTA